MDGMTRPVDEYLGQLRASLRTKPAETSRILAEAEDHLRESVAAGLRAGMTEVEAQEAAVSAFGSVRAVVRAHQTRRARAIAVLGGCAMTSWKLAGLSLLAFGVSGLALLAEARMTHAGRFPMIASGQAPGFPSGRGDRQQPGSASGAHGRRAPVRAGHRLRPAEALGDPRAGPGSHPGLRI